MLADVQKHRGLTTLFQYLLAAFLSLFFLAISVRIWHLKLSIPFFYSWDSVWAGAMVKSLIETHWYIFNPYLGAPNGYNLLDYPIADNMNFFTLKLLAYFSSHFAVVMNSFYILTYPVTAMVSLFVLKRMGLKFPFALAASLLFVLQPYHFFRGEEGHLFLTAYYVVPLVIWLAVLIATQQLTNTFKPFKWIGLVLLCLLIGSSGIYYALFGVFFLMVSGLLTSLYDKKYFPLLQSIVLSGLIGLTLIINVSPSIIHRIQYGPNIELINRMPFESEIYGLKISQMLLPLTQNKIYILAKLKARYNDTAPLITHENEYTTLGIIAGAGFLMLIAMVFLGKTINREINLISKLNLAAVLLATVGGFGTLFAYTISPMIRCYSRISIFIAFFSLYGFFFFFERFCERYFSSPNKKPALMAFLFAVILGLGTFNNVAGSFAHLEKPSLVAEFNNDENFVRLLEKTLPPDSMIYQLPYIPFPEHSPPGSMVDYDHLKPYLHSHNLKWSYGAMKGRAIAEWQENMSALPTKEMLLNISYAGYNGIYINRNGYADRAKQLEEQLSKLLNQKPIVSDNHTLAFFDIRSYVNHLKKNQSSSAWNENIARSKTKSNISTSWGKGFYQFESSSDMTWRWGNKHAELNIINYSPKPIRATIHFTLATGSESLANIWLKSAFINKQFKANIKGTSFTKTIDILPGMNKFYFYSDANRLEAPGDGRQLYFRVENFYYEIPS